MIPSAGHLVKLNQQFIADVRRHGESSKNWMIGYDTDEFYVEEVEQLKQKGLFSIVFKSIRTGDRCKISIKKGGLHPLKGLSDAAIFEFTAQPDDICNDCGVLGEKIRMACICKICGMTIWGC